ncbi:hypothetical protein C3F09_03260 [candidate division GN15 bacterium]|uniref:DUF3108 domain-containing protein n=1 Tax=candidate division GN15 bacterium TaxID=2072418 RepID=A0A855X9V6_9BACT|nr:MAG: hypothetical protein C3F09_03260 [candidate division GN15 bacterium]
MKRFARKHPVWFRSILVLTLLVSVLVVVYFVTAASGEADTGSIRPDTITDPSKAQRVIDNTSFGVGEKLTFDINYGFINAGSATMEVKRLIEYQGRPCYLIQTTAQSNSFFSSFYRVEDSVESITDAVGIFSWWFQKNLNEGSYKARRVCSFDQPNQRVVEGKDTISVAPFVQDALSTLFYVRTQKLEVGKSVYLDNYVDGKAYKLEVKVLRKETVKVDAGSFDCIVVEPLTSSVGVFKHEGRLTVWLTDDRLKMPVLMKSKVLVGSISAELIDFKLGEIQEL